MLIVTIRYLYTCFVLFSIENHVYMLVFNCNQRCLQIPHLCNIYLNHAIIAEYIIQIRFYKIMLFMVTMQVFICKIQIMNKLSDMLNT